MKRVIVLVVELCSQLNEAAIISLSKGTVVSQEPLSWKDILSKIFLNEHCHYPITDGTTLSF